MATPASKSPLDSGDWFYGTKSNADQSSTPSTLDSGDFFYQQGATAPEGVIGTIARGTLSQLFPALTTAAGATIGAGLGGVAGIESGPGALVTAGAGALAGGVAGGAAGEGIQSAVMGKDWTERNKKQMLLNAQAHPWAAALGDMLPFLASTVGGGTAAKVGDEVVGHYVTTAGRKAIEKAAEEGAAVSVPAVERIAHSALVGARAGGSKAAQEIVDNPEATPTVADKIGKVADEAAKGALAFGATGVLPHFDLNASAFMPAAKSLLLQVGVRGTTDAAAMALSNSLYDTMVHGKQFDVKELENQLGGDVPAFWIQNAIMGAIGLRAAAKNAGRIRELQKQEIDNEIDKSQETLPTVEAPATADELAKASAVADNLEAQAEDALAASVATKLPTTPDVKSSTPSVELSNLSAPADATSGEVGNIISEAAKNEPASSTESAPASSIEPVAPAPRKGEAGAEAVAGVPGAEPAVPAGNGEVPGSSVAPVGQPVQPAKAAAPDPVAILVDAFKDRPNMKTTDARAELASAGITVGRDRLSRVVNEAVAKINEQIPAEAPKWARKNGGEWTHPDELQRLQTEAAAKATKKAKPAPAAEVSAAPAAPEAPPKTLTDSDGTTADYVETNANGDYVVRLSNGTENVWSPKDVHFKDSTLVPENVRGQTPLRLAATNEQVRFEKANKDGTVSVKQTTGDRRTVRVKPTDLIPDRGFVKDSYTAEISNGESPKPEKARTGKAGAGIATPAPAAPAERRINPDAVKRKNIEPDGKIWLNGERVEPTDEHADLAIGAAQHNLESHVRQLEKIDAAEKAHPNPTIDDVRRVLPADSRPTTFEEARRLYQGFVKRGEQYIADVREANKAYNEHTAAPAAPVEETQHNPADWNQNGTPKKEALKAGRVQAPETVPAPEHSTRTKVKGVWDRAAIQTYEHKLPDGKIETRAAFTNNATDAALALAHGVQTIVPKEYIATAEANPFLRLGKTAEGETKVVAARMPKYPDRWVEEGQDATKTINELWNNSEERNVRAEVQPKGEKPAVAARRDQAMASFSEGFDSLPENQQEAFNTRVQAMYDTEKVRGVTISEEARTAALNRLKSSLGTEEGRKKLDAPLIKDRKGAAEMVDRLKKSDVPDAKREAEILEKRLEEDARERAKIRSEVEKSLLNAERDEYLRKQKTGEANTDSLQETDSAGTEKIDKLSDHAPASQAQEDAVNSRAEVSAQSEPAGGASRSNQLSRWFHLEGEELQFTDAARQKLAEEGMSQEDLDRIEGDLGNDPDLRNDMLQLLMGRGKAAVIEATDVDGKPLPKGVSPRKSRAEGAAILTQLGLKANGKQTLGNVLKGITQHPGTSRWTKVLAKTLLSVQQHAFPVHLRVVDAPERGWDGLWVSNAEGGTNMILINASRLQSTEHAARIVLHEIFHEWTYDALESPINKLSAKARSDLDSIYHKVKQVIEKEKLDFHAGEDLHEFLAGVLTDPAFQRFLNERDAEFRPVKNAGVLVTAMRKITAKLLSMVTGKTVSPDSALAEAAEKALRVVESEAKTRANFSENLDRQILSNRQQASLSNHDWKAYERTNPDTGTPSIIAGAVESAAREAGRTPGGRNQTSGGERPLAGIETHAARAVASRVGETYRRTEGVYRELAGLPEGLTDAQISASALAALSDPSARIADPKVEKAVNRLRELIPLITDDKFAGIEKLPLLEEGAEGQVYFDEKKGLVYKVLFRSPNTGQIGDGYIPDHIRPDGFENHSGRPYLLEVMERHSLNNEQGRIVSTEVAGITPDGRLVLVQPYIEGLTRNVDASKGLRENGLVTIHDGDLGAMAVGWAGNVPIVVGDLHDANAMRGADGRTYVIDATTRRLTQDEIRQPKVSQALSEAKRLTQDVKAARPQEHQELFKQDAERQVAFIKDKLSESKYAGKKLADVPEDVRAQWFREFRSANPRFTPEGVQLYSMGEKQPGELSGPLHTASDKLGLTYQGDKNGVESLFTDPKTGATFSVQKDAPAKVLEEKLARVREAYGEPLFSASKVDEELSFRTRNNLLKLINKQRGGFYGLEVAKDGTVPWQNIKAQIAKTSSKAELGFLLPTLETLVKDGRVNASEAARALEMLAASSVEVHKYGQHGSENSARYKLDKMTHEWFETLNRKQQEAYSKWEYYTDTRMRELYPEDARVSEENLRALGVDLATAREFYALKVAEIEEDSKGSEPAATGYYRTVSPFDTQRFPVERIDVVIPTVGPGGVFNGEVMGKDERGGVHWRQDDLHENLPNTLGWAMVQVVPDPKTGKSVMFVGEQQSRWGQTKKFEIRRVKGFGPYSAEAFRSENEAERFRQSLARPDDFEIVKTSPTHPLLDIQHALVLKAVIREAARRGISEVGVSTGVTTSITEKHDVVRSRGNAYPANESGVEKVEVGQYGLRYSNGQMEVYGDKEKALEAQNKLGERGKNLRLDVVVPDDLPENTLPPQFGGIQLHYDTTLPSAMHKLTGERGVIKDFGVHKNAVGYTPEQIEAARRTIQDTPELRQRLTEAGYELRDLQNSEEPHIAVYTPEGNYAGSLMDGELTDSTGEVQMVARGVSPTPVPTGSPVFKNANGTPVTNAFARVYDIRNAIKNNPHLNEIFSASGKASSEETTKVREQAVKDFTSSVPDAFASTAHDRAAWFNPNDGKVYYNPEALARTIAAIPEQHRETAAKSLIPFEENTHKITTEVFDDKDVASYVGKLSDSQKQAFQNTYGKLMTDKELFHEHVRATLSKVMRFGLTTEDLLNNPLYADKTLWGKTRQLFTRLVEFAKASWDTATNPILRDAFTRLLVGQKTMENLEKGGLWTEKVLGSATAKDDSRKTTALHQVWAKFGPDIRKQLESKAFEIIPNQERMERVLRLFDEQDGDLYKVLHIADNPPTGERYVTGGLYYLAARAADMMSTKKELPEGRRKEFSNLAADIAAKAQVFAHDWAYDGHMLNALKRLVPRDFARYNYVKPIFEAQKKALQGSEFVKGVDTAMGAGRQAGAAAGADTVDRMVKNVINKVAGGPTAAAEAQEVFDFFRETQKSGSLSPEIIARVAKWLTQRLTPKELKDPALIKKIEAEVRAQFDSHIREQEAAKAAEAAKADIRTPEEKIADAQKQVVEKSAAKLNDLAEWLDDMKGVFDSAKERVLPTLTDEQRNLVKGSQFEDAKLRPVLDLVRRATNLREAVGKSLAEREATREQLVSDVLSNMDVTEAQANSIANAIRSAYELEAQKTAKVELDRLGKTPARRVPPTEVQKLLRMMNLGAFDEEKYYNLLSGKFKKLPKWDENLAQYLKNEGERIQAMPENSSARHEAEQMLLARIAKEHNANLTGGKKFRYYVGELLPSVWISGALSGLTTTHVVNFTSTAANVGYKGLVRALATMAADRQKTGRWNTEYLKDYLVSYAESLPDAWQEMKRGITEGVTRTRSIRGESLSVLEHHKWTKLHAIIGRLLSSEDAFNTIMAEHINKRLGARYFLGLDPNARQLMEEAFHPDSSTRSNALDTARQEAAEGLLDQAGWAGKSKEELARLREQAAQYRVHEVLESSNELLSRTAADARDAGLDWTFNRDVQGLMGLMTDNMLIRFTKDPATRPFFVYITSFMKTMTNLINTGIEYSPLGALKSFNWSPGQRLLSEHSKYLVPKVAYGSPEYYEHIGRSVLGTLIVGTIAGLALSSYKDEKDGKEPYFAIFGGGNALDRFQRQQRVDSGKWSPSAIKVGGTMFRYTDWPGLNFMLGALGEVFDKDRFAKPGDQTSPEARAAQFAFGATTTILDKNLFQGLNNLMDVLRYGGDNRSLSAAKNLSGSIISGYTNPALLRWVTDTFAMDGNGMVTRRSQDGLENYLLSLAPFGSLAASPKLDVLGREIQEPWWQATTKRFVQFSAETDPVISKLYNMGLTIKSPSKNIQLLDHGAKSTAGRDADTFERFVKLRGKYLRETLTPENLESLRQAAVQNRDNAQDLLDSWTSGARQRAVEELSTQ